MKSTTELEIRRCLAQRVSQLRHDRHWTQATLAAASRVPRSYIADIECARRNPSLRTMVRIANALDVGLESLFRDEGR